MPRHQRRVSASRRQFGGGVCSVDACCTPSIIGAMAALERALIQDSGKAELLSSLRSKIPVEQLQKGAVGILETNDRNFRSGQFLWFRKKLHALLLQVLVHLPDALCLQADSCNARVIQRGIGLSLRQRSHELEQINTGGLLVVPDAKVNAFHVRHGQTESISHFLTLHALAKIHDHLKAEQFVEGQGSLEVRTVDVEMENPLDFRLQIAPPFCRSRRLRPDPACAAARRISASSDRRSSIPRDSNR